MQNVDKIKDYNFDMDKGFQDHTIVVQKMNKKLVNFSIEYSSFILYFTSFVGILYN